MPSLRCTADINGTRETIFDLIADLAHYDRWLPGSRVFGGMTQVSPVSPDVGTTYADGTMRGSITEFNPPVLPHTVVDNSDNSPTRLTAWETLLILPYRKELFFLPISNSEDRYVPSCVRVPARGLPPALAGAALAFLLVPSSAIPLKRWGHPLHSPPSA